MITFRLVQDQKNFWRDFNLVCTRHHWMPDMFEFNSAIVRPMARTIVAEGSALGNMSEKWDPP